MKRIKRKIECFPNKINIDTYNFEYVSILDFYPYLYSLLTTDEKERAERFYFKEDQYRFVCGRSVLKILISDFIDKSPSNIKFSYNKYGKPFIEYEDLGTNFYFNISHSFNKIYIALSNEYELGVDIEFVNSTNRFNSIAPSIMSSIELDYYDSLSMPEKKRFFYLAWVQKEAISKLYGKGLSLDFKNIKVILNTKLENWGMHRNHYVKVEKEDGGYFKSLAIMKTIHDSI